MSAPPDSFDFAASGRRVFAVEADALAAVAARVDGAFSAACRAMLPSCFQWHSYLFDIYQ